MNELPSAQFRTQYAKLREPTLVTVNGHPIGQWMPFTKAEQGDLQDVIPAAGWPAGKGAQAQRDELLRKINRGK